MLRMFTEDLGASWAYYQRLGARTRSSRSSRSFSVALTRDVHVEVVEREFGTPWLLVHSVDHRLVRGLRLSGRGASEKGARDRKSVV